MSRPMHRNKRSSWVFALLISIFQLVFILTTFSEWGYDDAFITYRYAENLAHGMGFVYNPGEHVLSTTTPLFAILLALFNHLFSNLPQLATMIGAICLPVGSLLLWDLLNTWKKPFSGWFTLLIYPIFPLLLNTLGSEIPLYLALCMGAFALYARSRYSFATVCVGLASLTRPEGVLVAFILLVHFIITYRRIPSWTIMLTFALICLPWIFFSVFYFGSPIPVTLAAKQVQGSLDISQHFTSGLFTLMNRGYSNRWQYSLLIILSILGLLSSVQAQDRRAWIIPAWSILHFISLSLLGVTSYFWYYAPLIPGFIVLSGLGLEELSMRIPERWITKQRLRSVLGMSIIFILMFMIGRHARDQSQFPDHRLGIYQAIGEWIQAHTEENTQVGSLEVGIIGYYAQRHMIDFAGIIQPEVAEILSQSKSYQDSMLWAITTFRPEALVLARNQFPDLVLKVPGSHCKESSIFTGDDYGYPGDLLVVQCEW